MKDSKKKTMILTGVAVVTLALFVVGATYAYFTAQGGDPAAAKINVTTYTTDVLTFATGDDINIYADQESFASGKGNATGSTYAKATLTANNKTNTATANYYVYLNIENNTFEYTIDNNTPELILTVTDADGNEITDISGLTHISVTDGKGETVSGYDITMSTGLQTLFNNREITATPQKEEQWDIKLTLVNYDKDQTKNAGKKLKAKVIIKSIADVTITTNNLPTTYGKLGSINCSDSSATYNQQYNRIEVSDINTEHENCTLDYTDSPSEVIFATYIIGLAGTTQGTGEVVNENGYRYEGKNPNNYVWFNNEYWRIIGVFDSDSHGQSNKNLVKIIRDSALNPVSWNKNSNNDWTTSSLNSLLNSAYYHAQDGTDLEYCYLNYYSVTTNCNYTKSGIQNGYREMIANVTWHLGGSSNGNATANKFYEYERGTNVYNGNPTTTTGYIGLMYPSDYGYSVLSSSCARTSNLSSYYNSSCAGQSWMNGIGFEWTITQRTANSNVFYLYSYGSLANEPTSSDNSFRPVVYLNSSIYINSGNGSLENPYIIGM